MTGTRRRPPVHTIRYIAEVLQMGDRSVPWICGVVAATVVADASISAAERGPETRALRSRHPEALHGDRYVVVVTGTAVDRCRRGAPVPEATKLLCVDIHAAEPECDVAVGTPHRLRICLRYRECPTEEIPVLCDECGGNESCCGPDRVVKRYRLDVRVIDGPLTPDVPCGPRGHPSSRPGDASTLPCE
jgi:hypothetical protein